MTVGKEGLLLFFSCLSLMMSEERQKKQVSEKSMEKDMVIDNYNEGGMWSVL